MSLIFLQKIFSLRKASYFCFALAFVNKCLIAIVYTQVSSDKALYLLISKTIALGRAPLEDTGLVDGLPNYFFNGAITSPLYSIMAVPFFWITNSVTTTSIILDCISWFAFISGIYVLGNILLKEKWLINLLILLLGFFIYPHELNPGPKDTLAAGLFCWACILIHWLVSSRQKFANWLGLYIILLALGLLKYLYLPVSIFFPIMVLIITFSKKDHLWKQMLLLILVLCTSFYLFHEYLEHLKKSSYTTSIISVPEVNNTKGFYPENLSLIYPFIVSSVVDTMFLSTQFSNWFGLTFQQTAVFWKVIELLLTTILLYYLISSKKRLTILDKICLGAGLSILLITMLASTVIKKEQGGWTFVSDPRFYLFPIQMVQLFFSALIVRRKTTPWIKFPILALSFIGFLHGIYFTTKQIINYKQVQQNLVTADSELGAFYNNIERIADQHQNIKFASNNSSLRRLAQINNKEVLFFRNDSSFILNQENYPLIVAVERKDSAILHAFNRRTLISQDQTNRFLIKAFK